MTVSKYPAHTDQGMKGTKDVELNNSIDELENLISDKTGNGTDHAEENIIPVLDEVIDPDSLDDDIDEFTNLQPASLSMQSGIFEEQLDNLMGTMDERITGELDVLVNILKDAIKDSILTELKSRLEHNRINPPPEKPDSDN